MNADDLIELARHWRNQAGEDGERADHVALAIESLANYRRDAAAPRSRARRVGRKLSALMRI